jgi:glycerol-3-phosphate dehydrogenase subunit B
MMKPIDVLVAGSGMAGLIAALAAATRGKNVRIAARGAGALAIGGGCVDLLGYINNDIVRGNPLEAIAALPDNHPYRLVGAEAVREALEFFQAVCRKQGLVLVNSQGENHWIPSILGIFKPSFLCPENADRDALARADMILIPQFSWLKDCHAGMARSELQRQKRLKDKLFATPLLTPPQGPAHRNQTPLDVAHRMDTPKGEAWLSRELATYIAPVADKRIAVLLPPILGIKNSNAIRKRLEAELGCTLVEMASSPPGVTGLRIREALKSALTKAGVIISENTTLVGAKVEGAHCVSLFSAGPDKRRELPASAFIIATGGFFGGGAMASPGRARESIFELDLGAPETVEAWSAPDVFDPQPYARLGVRVNARLNPITADGKPLLDNVFFAGRALAGYDHVLEKCGHGVAIATGWHAAQLC